MNSARIASPGKTRVCPHCRSEILDSASVCPACQHHLRFARKGDAAEAPTFPALSVDGTIQHPGGPAWEYSVVVSMRNEQGQEVLRRVVGVGALTGNESRTFRVTVDVHRPE
jgi:predicted amidophosphoribosyltransferase